MCATADLARAQAQGFHPALHDGRAVQIDPVTRRATVSGPGGVNTQLWDGVHRLQDGTTITVSSGIVVPTQQMLQGPQRLPVPLAEEGPSPCLVLLRKTCGLHDECRDQDSCGHAAQLVRNEQDELLEHRGSGLFATRHLQTTSQCRQALLDTEFFRPCLRPQRGPVLTPCERLVDRVCGRAGECDAAPACHPAHQLLEAECQERSASLYPDALTDSSAQCNQALQDREFFLPCER
jgi:hypothetical protein